MKLNESKAMWVLQFRDGLIDPDTLSGSEYNTKCKALQGMRDSSEYDWDYYATTDGWQCIPVNVLITPKEGQHTVNTEKVP